ncbi:hypothetical protein ACFE04_007222 [Oxalis oulophora]
MAKIYPNSNSNSNSSSFSSSSYMTVKRETFTIWMKSLVCNSYGCTAFDSNGEIVYRVENYDTRGRSEVYLMDLKGQVLVTIRKKKYLSIFGRWDGYKWSRSKRKEEMYPWFQFKRHCKFLKGDDGVSEAIVGCNKYHIVKHSGKAAFRVVNRDGNVLAEIKEKQSSSGVRLGEDVLTMVVEPQVDHCLIMSLVTVYGLINRKM